MKDMEYPPPHSELRNGGLTALFFFSKWKLHFFSEYKKYNLDLKITQLY